MFAACSSTAAWSRAALSDMTRSIIPTIPTDPVRQLQDMKTFLAPSGTDAVHAGVRRDRPDHGVAPAIAQTSTYAFRDTAELTSYFEGRHPDPDRQEYGRYGNPTVLEVERRVAALDGAADALLFSSGMAAVTTAVLAIVKA